jgi:phosphohistidine phosphatase SixA
MNRRIIEHSQFVRVILVVLVFFPLISGAATSTDSNGDLWAAMHEPGTVVLMRHALAPGNGDPTHFDVNNCSTQRNLSDTGRQQARKIGQLLRDKQLESVTVYSSQWCRCLETAELLALGNVKALPALNSFYQDRSTRETQTLEILRFLDESAADNLRVLVTHQVNITALSGVYPTSGEMIVVKVKDSLVTLLGRIATQ